MEALAGEGGSGAAGEEVEADVEVVEGGGGVVGIEAAAAGGVEAEEAEEWIDAPTIRSVADDVFAEGA